MECPFGSWDLVFEHDGDLGIPKLQCLPLVANSSRNQLKLFESISRVVEPFEQVVVVRGEVAVQKRRTEKRGVIDQ